VILAASSPAPGLKWTAPARVADLAKLRSRRGQSTHGRKGSALGANKFSPAAPSPKQAQKTNKQLRQRTTHHEQVRCPQTSAKPTYMHEPAPALSRT